MRRALRIVFAAFLAGSAWSAQAALQIEITQGLESATPIAVARFGWSGAGPAPPQPISEIIAANLARSGRFAPLEDLPQHPARREDVRWSDWRRLQIGNLVIGTVNEERSGGGSPEYLVEFWLFDTFTGGRLAALRYGPVRGGELRRVAHLISDEVYRALTGERGAFATYIAYITENADREGRIVYALHVADSDGANAFSVFSSPQPVMSPTWSSDGRRLAYVSYEGNRPRIFVHELATAARRVVADFPGLNNAPSFSPDGSLLAMTLSRDGNPEIYALHLQSGSLRRLTENPGIDTEPVWSPDGRDIVFTSDRSGRPQLYRMPVEGGGAPQRLTFTGTYNARAAFSPDGSRIAFVHGSENGYHIAVMEAEGQQVRVLTNGRLDESPSFAPNGRMILYATTEGGRPTLAAVSVDGRFRQRLSIEEATVREPAWSPSIGTRRTP